MTDHDDIRPPNDLTDVPSQRWRVEVVEETTSTNADVAERFRGGEQEGLVLVAEHQSAGRGRMGREWVAPPRSSLTASFLLVPSEVPPERWPWLPLLTGVATAAAVRRVTGVEVDLKWPNDVLADGQKLGGILLERVDHGGAAAAVVGVGINCTQSVEELPVPEATSLAFVTGAPVDRSAVLGALVEELAARYDEWRDGADLRPAYLELCATPGQDVRVAVPGGEVVGEAVDVDEAGRLVVRTDEGEERLGAGDVVHVRRD
jgi:BirA family transcriptional regulator, biotin operon repressor / biotin---[acetyl-CoA-carboxylase] ligase